MYITQHIEQDKHKNVSFFKMHHFLKKLIKIKYSITHT